MSTDAGKEIAKIFSDFHMKHYKKLFKETQNPLYIWQAIMAASPVHPWPAWIQVYLKKTAEELLNLPPQKRGLGNKIAQALGFPSMGKSAQERWRADQRKKQIIMTVFQWHKENPDRPLNQIFSDVAKELNISNATVENIFYENTHPDKKTTP